MDLIASYDGGGGIGIDGDLLWEVPGDLERFKEMTMGEVVLYGRKTAATFPNRRNLPGRTNIILTRNRYLVSDGPQYIVAHGIGEALRHVVRLERRHEVYLIGGAKTFKKLYRYCRYAYLTEIMAFCPADAFLPKEILEWPETYSGPWHEDRLSGITWRLRTLENPEREKAAWKMRMRAKL